MKPSAAPADLVIGESDVRDASGKVVVPIPADRSTGFDASYKRNGKYDLYVVPLVEPLKASNPHRPDLLRIDVAPNTAYRVLVEVMFTAGQTDWVGYDIRLRGAPERHFPSRPPRVGDKPASLALLVVSDGISIKGRGGNVAPGCEDTGPGLAIPKRDFAALGACLKKLKALLPDERTVMVTTTPDTPFETVLSTIEAARGPNETLFPDVTFGVPR